MAGIFKQRAAMMDVLFPILRHTKDYAYEHLIEQITSAHI